MDQRTDAAPPQQRPDQPLDLVVVGGGGHVGLPLTLAFAERGLCVGIVDIAEKTLDQIRGGHMPFMETGAEDLLRTILPTGRLVLSSDSRLLQQTRTIVVVIGTPIDEFMNPSTTIFERTIDDLAPNLVDGSLVVLRSTVYPGTTANVARTLRDRGCDVDVAF